VGAGDRQGHVRPGREVRHFARALMRQEVDVRIVFKKERQHRPSDVPALLIGIHQRDHSRPLNH
jgi:hypothetical protein